MAAYLSPKPSEWGEDDCITYLVGEKPVLPSWVRQQGSDEEAIRLALKKYGSMRDVWAHLLELNGFELQRRGEPPVAGGRAIGYSPRRGIVCARTEEDGCDYIRTRSGIERADFDGQPERWLPKL